MERWQKLREKWKQRWERTGSRVFLGLAFLLVALFSFEAGLLQKSLVQPKPLIIRVAEPAEEARHLEAPIPSSSENALPREASSPAPDPPARPSCALVGSKNSNKYHHPDSRCAKQIKAENKRCFASVDDAKSKGYVAGCLTP